MTHWHQIPAKLAIAAIAFAGVSQLAAQTPFKIPPPDREIQLYDGVAPGSELWNWTERTIITRRGNKVTQNVVRPVLQYYASDKAKARGTAVIIAPGGGFTNLMFDPDMDAVRKLNAMGIEAFILKYRLIYVDPAAPLPPPGPLPPPPPPVRDKRGVILAGPQKGQNILELSQADGQRGVRWLRAHAGEFGVKPHRIGLIGFSAGGSVTLLVSTGAVDARPDFAAAIYGPGDETLVPPADAPPLFLAAAADDEWATEGSLALFSAWHKAKIPAELHIFQMGAHGFLNKGGGADHFMDRFQEWMRVNGWI